MFFFLPHQSTISGMAFALLLLLVQRFQPLGNDSKHEAVFNRVLAAVITLLAAWGVMVCTRVDMAP